MRAASQSSHLPPRCERERAELETPTRVLSVSEPHRLISTELGQTETSSELNRVQCDGRSQVGGGGGSERDAAPSADSLLRRRHLTSDRRRRESPVFTVKRGDGGTSGPARVCVSGSGDTVASLRTSLDGQVHRPTDRLSVAPSVCTAAASGAPSHRCSNVSR